MKILNSIVILLFVTACSTRQESDKNIFSVQPSVFRPDQFTAPRPEKKPHTLNTPFGDSRTDVYYWLNERENPAVKAYLEAENRYADSVLMPVTDMRERLFQEMKSRIKEDDNTVPYFFNGYWYYTRFETGKEYPIHCRKNGSLSAEEEILADVNQLAAGKPYCQFGTLEISPDNEYMAYSVDYSGRNLFTVYIKNLVTGQMEPESFDIGSSVEWAKDSRTLVYDTKDPLTLRVDKIWRHKMGTDPKQDVLIYEEKDPTTYAYLSKSKSGDYFFINSGYTQVQEVHYFDAGKPEEMPRLIRPREADFYYSVEHKDNEFLILTNWAAKNFRLMAAPVNDPTPGNWTEIIPHREDVLIEDFTAFQNFIVLSVRKGGLEQIQVLKWADKSEHYIAAEEPTYAMLLDGNPEYATEILRYNYTSLKTPFSTIDYNMDNRTREVKKVQPVLGGYDPENYETEFIWVTASDGVKVPVSLMYRKGTPKDGSAPMHLTGYGSYGFSYPPYFNREKVSLADRGFVIGIAHIRGGMEMGFHWYEQGKLLNKMNTFTDFIDCSEALCKQKYTSSDRLFAEGRSAGGLLMGAVANMRPDLYKGIIGGVPFVDVLTTMSDPDIPLTTGEYTEWGNPAVKEQYAYMAKYSPYDNLKNQNYPNMLVLSSFSDSQVQYFEPSKYVARLRDLKTDKNTLLLVTNMSGSHGGSSGRFEQLRERALEYSWMLGLLGSTTDLKQ